MLRISVVVTLVAGAVVCSHAQQAAAPAPQSAAAPPPAVVTMQPLGQGVYLLANGGPHAIAALAEDGVVLADAKLASVTTQIKTAIAGLTKQPIRYVITSHNHTANNGGNATLAREGAVIVGHENARRRMAAGSRMERMSIAPFAADALPVVTFSGQFSIHLRGQTITATHVARAHTDSDVVISFKEANVVFGSDLCRSNEYPLIGTTENGSVDGMIGALETIIALSDAQTKVVCAYGPVMSKADMLVIRELLVAVRDKVYQLKAQGSSEDQVVAANVLGEKYAIAGQDPSRAESFVRNVYRSLPQ